LEQVLAQNAPIRPEPSGSLAKWVLIIGAGIFATSLPQIADSRLDLPLKNVLTKELQLGLKDLTDFFFLATFPWYIKPLFGLLLDSIPLFGTRRRHYLILSSVLAGIMWLLLGVVPRSYWPLFVVLTMLNVMLVIGSTVVGALIVEVGQSRNAAGRLVAARNFIESACGVIAGTLGGFLAYEMSFSSGTVIGAAIAFSLAPVAYVWLTEPIKTIFESSVLKNASQEMRRLAFSRLMWPAALFIFFVSIPQGFEEARYFYQWKDLGFSTQEIGYLKSASGGGAAVACVVYGFVCRFVRLRVLLGVGILSSAAGTMIYVFYTSYQAGIAIETLNGFLATLGVLAFMEIAVWATPREASATGFSLLMGVWNLGDGVGNILTARIIEDSHVSFFGLIELYAAATVIFLGALWVLPKDLFSHREG
jgi:predicted MFS family arabinose efflux permease